MGMISAMIHAMTYDEFQRQIAKAGLSNRGFADLIQMNPNSLTNYAGGEVPTHLAVISALLGEMADRKIDFTTVLSRLQIKRKKPRGAASRGKFGGDKQRQFDLDGRPHE